VLNDVLGLLPRTKHVPAERQDAAVMAIVDLLKRSRATSADLLDQALITRRGQGSARQR